MRYKGIYWSLFAPMIRKSIARRHGPELAKKSVRGGKKEYRRLLERADELGPGNPMASNAYFAYVFAAAWLGGEKQYDLLNNVRSLTLNLFTDRQYAGAHCNVGNTKLALDTMADWIIQKKSQED